MLEQINCRHDDAAVQLERQMSDIGNADLTEAVTHMSQDQMVIGSALATSARLNQVMLADLSALSARPPADPEFRSCR